MMQNTQKAAPVFAPVLLATAVLCASAAAAELPGSSAFAAHDYAAAFSQAMAACEKSCEDVQLNLLIADAASKLGNTDEALAAYDRVLIFDEQNIPAHFGMAQIYAAAGNRELLAAELAQLLANPALTPEQRARLGAASKAASKHDEVQSPLSATLSLGFGYESNPKHENDKFFRVYLDGEEYIAQNEKSPGAASFIASADLSYALDFSAASKAVFGAGIYHKNYLKSRAKEYSDLDVISLSSVFSAQVSERLKISLPLAYDYIVLKNQGFLHSPSAGVDFAFEPQDGLLLGAGYAYSRGIFEKSYDKEDNYTHHAGYLRASLATGAQQFSATLSYDKERAPGSYSDASDYQSHGLALSHYYSFTNACRVQTSLGYTRTNYAKYSELFGSSRRDDDVFVSAELSYALSERFSVAANIGFGATNSNQDASDSKNFSTGLNCRYSF